MKALKHRIAHWFGWNLGRVESMTANGKVMVGFRCECGELTHPFEAAPEHIFPGRVEFEQNAPDGCNRQNIPK